MFKRISISLLFKFLLSIFFLLNIQTVFADEDSSLSVPALPSLQLNSYQDYSPSLQRLVSDAMQLTQLHLHYLYGSADPRNNGMDCSGTIHYLLQCEKIYDVPRSSSEIYQWVKKHGRLYTLMRGAHRAFSFANLKPGDLLFWAGTYRIHHHRNNGISHVMLYLGKDVYGQPIMFGADSVGRYSRSTWGVNVYDFKLHDAGPGHFVGYGCIPNLTCNMGEG